MENTGLHRKHFVVLAEELAHDKLYYRSEILFNEKYDRMIVYCKKSNKNFNPDRFKLHMLKQYEALKLELKDVKNWGHIGGTI